MSWQTFIYFWHTPTGDKRYTHYISFLSGNIRCEGDGVVMYGGHVDHHVGELSECSRECGERGSMEERVGHGTRMHARVDW